MNRRPAVAAFIDSNRTIIRLGSRKSALALVQTNLIKSKLEEQCPGLTFVIVEQSTMGDKILDVPLAKIGDKGLFTKELEESLIRGDTDLAVHSLKDVPTILPLGLTVGAIGEREDARDAVVMSLKNKGHTLETLPEGSIIGTSSLRRIAQLRRAYPHLQFRDIRGNLNTRLKKLDEGEYSAIILAVAGLNRLGWKDRVSQILSEEVSLHAVGQGALCVECRADDHLLLQLLKDVIHHNDTAVRCTAERSFLRTLEGGCQVPVGVNSTILSSLSPPVVELTGAILNLDGSECFRGKLQAPLDEAEALGRRLAEKLKAEGADAVLQKIYTEQRSRPKE